MNAPFTPGELVDVEIKGARVVDVEHDTNSLGILYRAGHSDAVLDGVKLMLGGATTATRVASKEWPPQPGDLWTDVRGGEWFTPDRAAKPSLISTKGGERVAEWVLGEYGPMTLTYRKGWTPTPAADVDQADEPGQLDERAASAALLRHVADGIDAGLPVPWTVSDHFDLYLYAPGYGAGPDTAAVDAWVAHIDPAGQATTREHGYDAKLMWRGACEVKVWTPAPRPAATDVVPSPPEEVAGPVVAAAGPATAADFAPGPVPDADGDLIPAAETPFHAAMRAEGVEPDFDEPAVESDADEVEVWCGCLTTRLAEGERFCAGVTAMAILSGDPPTAVPPPWDRDVIPDSQELPPLVEPAPHADDAYLPETRALLDAGRDAVARWDAAVAAHAAGLPLPGWARPVRGAS